MREASSIYIHKLRAWWKSIHAFERFLIITIGIVLAFLVGTAYYKLGETAIRSTRSANSAKTQSLKSDIAALPGLDTIAPGKTSGNLDYTVAKRQSLAKRISEHVYDTRPASSLFILHPSYPTSRQNLNADTTVIQSYAKGLEATTTNLTNLKKLIEYDAATDLAQPLSSPDSAERLERTKTGLTAGKSYLQRSSLPNNSELATDLQNLIDQTMQLSDATKPAWFKNVQSLQINVLESLRQSDIQSTRYGDSLDEITARYQ
jgi:hypothetical protein